MRDTLLRVNDALYSSCIWISGIAVVVMALIIPWGIFTRYVLGTGSQWPEPVSILLMVLFTFLGTAAAYRAGSHIAVAMLTDRLPAPLRRGMAYLVHTLMAVVSLFMLAYGVKLVIETMGQVVGQLPWLPVGITYIPVPLGGALTLLFVVEHLVFGSQAGRAVVTFDHEKAA
jgi:TRAP-type C4-dicarboxylate transport system permease small subunit